MPLPTLIKNFEQSAHQLVKAFCKKQGFYIGNTFWTGGVGVGILSINDQYSFTMEDIIMDLQRKAKKGLITEWQESCIEHHFDCQKTGKTEQHINYNSYIMGLRFEHLK